MRAIDRDDVHAREHLVEALPVGGVELFLDLGRHTAAVVIMDLQAEGARSPRDRLADAPHADDAEPLAPDAVAEHPGRRPAGPVLVGGQHGGALHQPPRHRQHQRHGHVGGVFGEHAGRVGDGDAALHGGRDVDIVDAVAEIGDQLELFAGLRQHRGVDPVGDGRHQDVGGATASSSWACVIGLSSGLSRASNSSRMRSSTLSGSLRVTMTSGFLAFGMSFLPRRPAAVLLPFWTPFSPL